MSISSATFYPASDCSIPGCLKTFFTASGLSAHRPVAGFRHSEAAEKIEVDDFFFDSPPPIFLGMSELMNWQPWTSSPWPTNWPALKKSNRSPGVAYFSP